MSDFENPTTQLSRRIEKGLGSHVGENAEFSMDSQAEVVETTALQSQSGMSRGLTIRCPHCRFPFEIVADADLRNVLCGSCKNSFNLTGETAEAENSATIAKIAHFELIERLGMGGFGTVWKARDTELGRIVAVKIPRKGMLNAEDLDSFLHEARVAAQLTHPNIVNVFEIGRDGDTAYIVSEMMEGKSLAVWTQDHQLTHRQTAMLCEKICRALHHAHVAGVIHRDLKPGNILMDEAGEPHITDFGLAKREAGDVTMTMDGHVLGTPAYMSPEQALGAISNTDRRSDLYSIGVILFQMLTNELPFRGNIRMLIHQAINNEPPSPSSLNSTIPADLETICLKCLEKEPARRYQTAAELADEFQRFLNNEPILARPLSPIGRAWRWCRRNPLGPGLAVGMAAVLALVYAVSWIWFQSAYKRLDQELTARALTGNLFSANVVAEAAGRDLERRFEAVTLAARDPKLIEAVKHLQNDEKLAPILKELSNPNGDPDEHQRLRAKLLSDPRRSKLDRWTQHQKNDPEFPVFAWFVLLADGLQVARHPVEDGETIGRNYAWRSYYQNDDEDKPEEWRPLPGQQLQETKLSSVFVSQFTNQWVVSVSAPIYSNGEFLGVLGMMVELGKFAELPGNERQQLPSGSRRFATLVDSRTANHGQLLQHPLYSTLEGKKRRELLDRSQKDDHLVSLGDWSMNDDYRDPFGGEHDEYDLRWLAAKTPVRVHREGSGLFVIVQESYDEVIGSALATLANTVVYLSAATLALAVLVVGPIMVLLPRFVRAR